MLVLLSFGLVLAATALLVLALLMGDGLTLIYVSIGLSALAGLILFVVRTSAPAPVELAAPPHDVDRAESSGTDEAKSDRGDDEDDEREVFPIADYDELTTEEILPLISELYDDELDVVVDRERASQSRAAILTALDQQRGATPAQDLDDAAPSDGYGLPILDYDELSVSEIVSVLGELDEEELEDVKSYEQDGRSRTTIIANIDQRLARIAR